MSDSITTDYTTVPSTPQAPVPPVVSVPPENQPSLNIADIQNALKIIDYAAEQGAFKGWTIIEQVLVSRNRLNDFVKAVTPVVPNPASPDATLVPMAKGSKV